MTIALRHPSARSGHSVAIAFALSLAVHGGIAAALLWLPGSVAVRDVPIEIEFVLTSDATAAPPPPAAAAPAAPAARRPVTATTPSAIDPVPVVPEEPIAADEPVPADVLADAADATTAAPRSAEPDVTVGSDATVAESDAQAQRGFVELHVSDWLAQHRRYPRAAARARLEGVVHVTFKLVPDGRIVEGRLETSSGARVLDGAALELLERASPIPGIAQFAMTGPIELRLPIQYRLRRATKA